MAMEFDKTVGRVPYSRHHYLIRRMGSRGKALLKDLWDMMKTTKARRHVLAASVTVLLVIFALIVDRLHGITPIDISRISLHTTEVTELDGIRTKLTVKLWATPANACDASMHIELDDGVESTRVYSAGLFNEVVFLSDGWAVKEVILPVYTPPGKARLSILGEFRCSWLQRITSHTEPLGSGIVKVSDVSRWNANSGVQELRQKIQALTVYLEHLRNRVEALERRNN